MAITIKNSIGGEQTNEIKDGSITTEKLADGSITSQKLADNSVEASKIDWSAFGFQYQNCPRWDGTSASTPYAATYIPTYDATFNTVVGAKYMVICQASFVSYTGSSTGELDFSMDVENVTNQVGSGSTGTGSNNFTDRGSAYGRSIIYAFQATSNTARLKPYISAEHESARISAYQGAIMMFRIG